MRPLLALLPLAALGCFDTPPTASPLRDEGPVNRHLTSEIHFLEHSTRATGQFITATSGFDSPFHAHWRDVLVATSKPTSPSSLPPPHWTGKSPSKETIEAIYALPPYRSLGHIASAGNTIAERINIQPLYLISTDPLIVAVPARLSFVHSTRPTPNQDRRDFSSADSLYFLIPGRLSIRMSHLIVYPANFRSTLNQPAPSAGPFLYPLPRPMSAAELLDSLTHQTPEQISQTLSPAQPVPQP